MGQQSFIPRKVWPIAILLGLALVAWRRLGGSTVPPWLRGDMRPYAPRVLAASALLIAIGCVLIKISRR